MLEGSQSIAKIITEVEDLPGGYLGLANEVAFGVVNVIKNPVGIQAIAKPDVGLIG